MTANDVNIAQLSQVIFTLNETIKSLDITVNELKATVKQQQETIAEKDKYINTLTEAVLALRREKYGTKSEKTRLLQEEAGQINLFNELEVVADPNFKEEEPVKKDRKRYAVRKPKRKIWVSENLPVREIDLPLQEEDQVCDNCGTKLKLIGKKIVRECIEYIPAKVQILRYITYAYECPKCKHTGKPFFVNTVAPKPVLNHSLVSSTSVANVIYQKYVQGVPLYRQEKSWMDMGVDLSRTTMANWVIRCSEEYFAPLVEHMKRSLLSRQHLHCDETPVQVLKEEGRSAESKSYMWCYTTVKDDSRPVVIYDYHPSRAGKCAKDFLEGFKGYIHTDGYSGYNQLKNVVRCGCWAHIRRKFFEAIAVKTATSNEGTANIGLQYCDKLFEIERRLEGLSPEERYLKRLELEKPVLEAFWCWLDSVNALEKSKLGSAIKYAKNQRQYMENYLKDGRCELSNNKAENAIRPFTVGRKNWLFSDSPKGAKASANVYSLVESAKANDLNVYKYFTYILSTMPDLDWHNDPSLLDNLMPWSEDAKLENPETVDQ